jgi:hypothetical protein
MRASMKLSGMGKRLAVGTWSQSLTKPSIPTPLRRAFTSTSIQHISTTTASENEITKPSTSSLIALAATITRETETLNKYLIANNLPSPSFDVSTPANFPKLSPEAKKAREEIIRATLELRDLVVGPEDTIRWTAFDNNKMVPLHAIYKYGIAQAVPVGGRIGYKELSEKTGLDEVNLRRFLRHAMTDRVCALVNLLGLKMAGS